jgi:hypothetical protein
VATNPQNIKVSSSLDGRASRALTLELKAVTLK